MGSAPLHKAQTSAGRTRPLHIPIRHRGLCLHTCQQLALVLPAPPWPRFSCLVSLHHAQHTHPAQTHLCNCKELILGISAEAEVEHGPRAQPQGHCISGHESTALDLLKESCWISLPPHKPAHLQALLIPPCAQNLLSSNQSGHTRLPSQPPGTALIVGCCQSTAGSTATAQRCRQLTCSTQGLVQLSVSLLRASSHRQVQSSPV